MNSTSGKSSLPTEIYLSLQDMGFIKANERIEYQALTGGIASDIWRIDTQCETFCIKRALSQLRVAQRWEVSTDRNAFEVRWFQTVAQYLPSRVPTVLKHDVDRGIFAMNYFSPESHPVWKHQLRAGCVDSEFTKQVAVSLALIHQRSAKQPELARDFDSLALFHQIRIEPYFLATAKKHPLCADKIEALAQTLAHTKIALVHGDISPKNILVGVEGPIFLDAECAVYGDPAFDLAFLLNHVLLKSIWCPWVLAELMQIFTTAYQHYLPMVDWEDSALFEERVCAFLGVFLLARIDGKSPVEYICKESEKQFVRMFGQSLLNKGIPTLQAVGDKWNKDFVQEFGIDCSNMERR